MQWECVLPDALHSIRPLLCTATNATPHERLFHFTRRSTLGVSIPTWLSAPGPVFSKRHLRSSKYDPIVDEVELVHATPNYAQIRFPSGRESTVPLRDIAPVGRACCGVEWNMELQEKICMEYGMAQVWNGRFDVWNGTKSSIFHTYSMVAHFDMVLLKSGFSFS